MSDKPECFEVVIVGLGPTGLILAHQLGRRGRKVLVLEREPEFYGNARAVYTDDECMRIFQSIGQAQALAEKMLMDTPVQLVRQDDSVLVSIKDTHQPFGWPIFNFFYQPYLETALSDALDSYSNVTVMRGREVVDFQQDNDRVTVIHQATKAYRFKDESDEVTTVNGELGATPVECGYLIGADGGRSIVRTLLGVEMDGKNFPEPWLVVDLEAKDKNRGTNHIPYFNFYCDPDCPAVSCPQPDGYHRFEFMLQAGQTKEYMERPATVRQYLSKYVNPDHFHIKRKLVYTFNALVAQKWRVGRVFLAGDAAHMTPQFIGQGMNAGVRDAHNLSWKLDLVLRGLAPNSLLDSYGSERYDHVKAMIDTAVLLKNIVSIDNPMQSFLRNLFLKGATSAPALNEYFTKGKLKPRPIFKRGKYFGLPRTGRAGVEGTLAPQPVVRTFHGRRVLLDDLLGDGFGLIGFGVNPLEHLSESNKQALGKIGFKAVVLYEYGQRPQGRRVAKKVNTRVAEVEDLHAIFTKWLIDAGLQSPAILILRPDRYVFAGTVPELVNEAAARLIQSLRVAKGVLV